LLHKCVGRGRIGLDPSPSPRPVSQNTHVTRDKFNIRTRNKENIN